MAPGVSNFPTGLDTLTELFRVVNDAASTIGAGGVNNSATTIPVTSTSMAPSDGSALIVNAAGNLREVVYYAGKTATTLTGCTRGADNSTARAWAAGDIVLFDAPIAAHHRVLAEALIPSK